MSSGNSKSTTGTLIASGTLYTSSIITQPTATFAGARIISQEDHEFWVEAKNFIQDVASSEDVPAGFREQAQRMVARLVMKKL